VRALRASGVDSSSSAAPLEVRSGSETPPHVEQATPVEGNEVRVRAVPGDPIVGFGAFLDGIQRSEVLAHRGAVPLVRGSVAAAIRLRRDRRMTTWNLPIVSHACYAPVAALDPAFVESLRANCTVVDTLLGVNASEPLPVHPGELSARALTAVQRARESAERTLAEAWTREGEAPLLIDGGISGSALVAQHPLAIGVVKSHRSLYVSGDSLEATLTLRAGERTTAVALTSPRRTTVATWYLRLRDPGSRGPFFGLVRVEVAANDPSGLTERADLVSRWLLAERSPVALPDARWDVMVHGIRDCEQYLSAILR